MALPCIICGTPLEGVTPDDGENQPYRGTAFTSHGHYGSTIFDPMDGSFLELNICDKCLDERRDKILLGKDARPVLDPQESIVGVESVKRTSRPWTPTDRDFDKDVLRVSVDEVGSHDKKFKDVKWHVSAREYREP